MFNIKQRKENKLRVVDLFCGAGIGALGVKYSGFNIIYAIDNNEYAVNTYNLNIKNCAKNKDIRKLDIEEIPDMEVLIATPVCKSFSFAGKGLGEFDKDTGDLSFYFLKILESKKPKAFLFENVNGICSKKHKAFFDYLTGIMESIGYKLTIKLIDCYDYGVPQHRKRVFIVGIRNDIDKKFEFPKELSDKEKKNIRYSINDLKEPKYIFNNKNDIYINNIKEILEIDIKNHYGYGIRNDEKPFIDKIKIGGNWRDLEEEDRKIFLGGAYTSKGGRTGFLRKLSIDNPSYCITSTMIGKNNAQILDIKDKYGEYIEGYIRNRRLTVRECLRLQTVLDEFYFEDNISLAKQYERCSGIPTLLAYKIMIEIEKVLL